MTDTLKRYEPIPVDSIDQGDDEACVIGVGVRAAGSCAAIEARAAGADVLVLERASGISGTTCAAGGLVYLGGGTRPQRTNVIDDTADEMFKYLMANTPEPEPHKLRVYCDESVSHFEWLGAQGVPFNDGFWKTKHHEPPSTDCLSWSGDEKAWPIRESARTVFPCPASTAAGACASNIAQDGQGYSSGTCIREATFFGRRAGRHPASQRRRT